MNIYPRIYDINAQQVLGAEVIERVCCPLCGEEAVQVKCKNHSGPGGYYGEDRFTVVLSASVSI